MKRRLLGRSISRRQIVMMHLPRASGACLRAPTTNTNQIIISVNEYTARRCKVCWQITMRAKIVLLRFFLVPLFISANKSESNTGLFLL